MSLSPTTLDAMVAAGLADLQRVRTIIDRAIDALALLASQSILHGEGE